MQQTADFADIRQVPHITCNKLKKGDVYLIQYCNFSFLDLEKLRGFFIGIITCINYYFSLNYIFLFICLFSQIIIINYFKTLPKYCNFYAVELGFFSFILLLEAGSSSCKMD